MTTDKPLRIIHCFRSPVGGVFRHIRDLIEDHVKAGHEVGILCDSSTGSEFEETLFRALEPKLALGLHRIPISRSIKPSDLIALYRSYLHIKGLKPDVIHGHSAKGGAIARLIGTALRANKQKVARLYSPHGGSLHYEKNTIKGRLFFLAERILERMTDAICFVCDYERRTYFEKVAHPLPLYTTIYNGLREEEFAPITLVPEARDFLYIGMMRDLKGPQIFIEAIDILARQQGISVTAHMVGDGPDKERYRAAIAARGLSDQITLHAAMPAREAFALAHRVVIPSLAEAMPYIVLEARAAEKDIIATNVGGIPEIFGDKADNLVAPGKATELAAAMLRHHGKQKVISLFDKDDFKRKFSTSSMAGDMMKLYCRILN